LTMPAAEPRIVMARPIGSVPQWEVRVMRRRSTLRSVLTVALASWMAASWSGLPALAQGQSVGDEAARATKYASQLERSLMAIEDGQREAPRDRWDPQYLVDTVGIEPADLYAYVRDNTAWVPYRGALRGPAGVLLDRRGNALDRALLLADMLTRAGHEVRLARATLSEDAAGAIWDILAARAVSGPTDGAAAPAEAPATPAEEPRPADVAPAPPAATGPTAPSRGGSLFGEAPTNSANLPPEEIAALYELDEEAVEGALADAGQNKERMVAELDSRVLDQGARLFSLFKNPDPAAQRDYEQSRAFAALTDHWWVQVNEAGAWVNYDLMMPDGQSGSVLAAPEATLAPDPLPAEETHRVRLRVVAEQLKDGNLTESVVLDHEFEPQKLIGTRIALRHVPMLWPAEWAAVTPDDVQEKLFAALRTQREWMPALTVGGEAFQQFSIKDTGEVNQDPQPQSNPFLQLSFPAAGKVGRVVDLFDESLDQMLPEGEASPAPAGDAPRTEGELTAEWLEYTILVPGEEPKTTRREIFDLIGPATRAAGDFSGFRMDDDKIVARAGGEMIETELVILPAWPAPEFLADMTARVALANKPLLSEFTRDPFGKAPSNSIDLFSKMSAIAGPAYLYSALRSETEMTRFSVYVDRPQVVAQHGVLTRVAPGELTAMAALDVIENGVGVDPFDSDPFFTRMLQGVADTNAEALALPDDGENVGEAFKKAVDGNEWTIFFPEDESFVASLGLAPDVSARLVADLRSGNVVVSPMGSAEAAERAGWWRIDPVTGATLGMGNNGWGSVLVEYAFYLTIQAMLAEIACMAYNAAAEDRISQLTAEQGREKVRAWARQCVSQALLQSISGMSVAWIQSRFIYGYAPSSSRPPSVEPSGFNRNPQGGFRNPPAGSRSPTGPRPSPTASNGGSPGPRVPSGARGPGEAPGQPREGNRPPRETRKPSTGDRKKSQPCHADAGFVKFAYAGRSEVVMSDAPQPFVLASTPGCPPDPPKRRAEAERAAAMKKSTDEHLAAHRRENEARREFEENPTKENAERFDRAVRDADRARKNELREWGMQGGDGIAPGFRPGAREPYIGPSNIDPNTGYQTGSKADGPVNPRAPTLPGLPPEHVQHDPPGRATRDPVGGFERTSPGLPPADAKVDPYGNTMPGLPPGAPPPVAQPMGQARGGDTGDAIPVVPPAVGNPPPPAPRPAHGGEIGQVGPVNPRDTNIDYGGDTLSGKEAGAGVGPHGTLVMGLSALKGAIGNGP
jgi:hypothetical protein